FWSVTNWYIDSQHHVFHQSLQTVSPGDTIIGIVKAANPCNNDGTACAYNIYYEVNGGAGGDSNLVVNTHPSAPAQSQALGGVLEIGNPGPGIDICTEMPNGSNGDTYFQLNVLTQAPYPFVGNNPIPVTPSFTKYLIGGTPNCNWNATPYASGG